MKRLSFATQLVLLWTLVAIICTLLVGIIWLFVQTDQSRQIFLASQQSTAACKRIATRYSLSHPFTADALDTDLMHAVLDTVLIQAPKVEGGFWQSGAAGHPGPLPPADHNPLANPARSPGGFLAYSFPTYEGTGIKRDIPEAETPLILRALNQAQAGHTALSESVPGGEGATVTSACPVAGMDTLYAWTLTRAQAPLGQYGHVLVLSLAAVLTSILAIALVLGIALRRWKHKLSALERGLSADATPYSTELPLTGEADLDRIIHAFNAFAVRSKASHARSSALSEQLQQAERFASLGKLAAQVAHEIRNPLGAVRLKLENVLAHEEGVQRQQLTSALAQVERIESQVSSLLALTQPVTLIPKSMDTAQWIEGIVGTHREQAKIRSVTLSCNVDDLTPSQPGVESDPASFDPIQMARALDNLILNAIRHAPSHGQVTVKADHVRASEVGLLRIAVLDNGPGVAVADRERIFEPFVTGRPDGSGLGLAVAREVATAHGGRAYITHSEIGACFVIDIPWHTYS